MKPNVITCILARTHERVHGWPLRKGPARYGSQREGATHHSGQRSMSRSRSPSRTSKSTERVNKDSSVKLEERRIPSGAARDLVNKVESQIDNLIDIHEQLVKHDVLDHMMHMNWKLGLHEPSDGPPENFRDKCRTMAFRKDRLEKELSAAKEQIINEFLENRGMSFN